MMKMHVALRFLSSGYYQGVGGNMVAIGQRSRELYPVSTEMKILAGNEDIIDNDALRKKFQDYPSKKGNTESWRSVNIVKQLRQKLRLKRKAIKQRSRKIRFLRSKQLQKKIKKERRHEEENRKAEVIKKRKELRTSLRKMVIGKTSSSSKSPPILLCIKSMLMPVDNGQEFCQDM